MTENAQTLTSSSEQNQEILQEEVIQSVMMSYQGPVMPPQLLQQLENVIEGGAERVLAMSEKEQSERHKITQQSTNAEIWQIKVSLIAGSVIMLALVGGIVFCAVIKYEPAIYVLGSLSLAGVVSKIIALPNRTNNKNN